MDRIQLNKCAVLYTYTFLITQVRVEYGELFSLVRRPYFHELKASENTAYK